MKKLILAGAAAIAVLTVPAVAQDTVVADAAGNVYVMTDVQQSAYDGWPAERQTIYTAWPDTYKTYYWTLTPTQSNGWWMLTDDQRARVYAMTPEQRVAAWTAIEQQVGNMPSANASATAQVATTAAADASTMGPNYVSNAVSQTTPAAKTDYPLCSATVTDSCVNPREAGKNYGNVPLKSWPGRPASEIPGKKPQV